MVNITGTLPGDDGRQYNISVTAAAQPAQPTTLALSALPASPQAVGTSVTFTATVAPSAPGTVTFTGTGNSTPVPVVNGVASQTVIVGTAGTLSIGASFTPSDPTAFGASVAPALSYTVASGETVLSASSYSSATAWAWQYGSLLGNTASSDQYAEADFSGCATTEQTVGFEFRAASTGGSGINVSVDNSRVHIEYPGQTGTQTWARVSNSASGHLRVELSGNVVKVYIGGVLQLTQTISPSPAPTAKGVRCLTWHDDQGTPALATIRASSLGAVPPQTVPAAPSLSGTTGGSGAAVLSWSSDGSATSFKVYQGATQVATATANSFTVTGLTNGTQYTFTVKASNSAGDSPASNAVNVTPSAGTPSGSFKLGTSGTGAGNGAMDRWMTRGPGIIQAMSTWSDNESYGFTNLTQEFGSWGSQPGQLIDVAVGAIWGDTWANAANGAWDARWRQRLTDLKAAWGSRPASNLRVRFAHEFNGNWMAWSTQSGMAGADPTAFKAGFSRWAGILRQVIPGALSVWSPNDGSQGGIDVTQYWPGLGAADRVGVDSYNQYPHAVSASDVQSAHFNSSSGFETWRQRCVGWGVTMCVPEWGNAGLDSGGGAGGGESPEYVKAFFTWAKANGGVGAGKVEYGNYFNIASGYAAHFQLFDGSGADSVQPQTAAAFRAF